MGGRGRPLRGDWGAASSRLLPPARLATGLPHLQSPTASGPLLQHRLEATLLRLGQFQSQLDWLLQWLLSTEEQLRSPLPLTPDLQSCEIELAKHQVVWGGGIPRQGVALWRTVGRANPALGRCCGRTSSLTR